MITLYTILPIKMLNIFPLTHIQHKLVIYKIFKQYIDHVESTSEYKFKLKNFLDDRTDIG